LAAASLRDASCFARTVRPGTSRDFHSCGTSCPVAATWLDKITTTAATLDASHFLMVRRPDRCTPSTPACPDLSSALARAPRSEPR
jgi:hypothetical protein